MYRTDGLMPNEENEKHTSQYDLNMFAAYMNEQDEVIDRIERLEDRFNGDAHHLNVSAFMAIGNKVINE